MSFQPREHNQREAERGREARGREAERQRGREAERQRGREAERQRGRTVWRVERGERSNKGREKSAVRDKT
jgi:hypothetical protein